MTTEAGKVLPQEIYDEARRRWASATAFRLGIVAGERGLGAEYNPYPVSSKGAHKCFNEGLEHGVKMAKQREENDE